MFSFFFTLMMLLHLYLLLLTLHLCIFLFLSSSDILDNKMDWTQYNKYQWHAICVSTYKLK